jgi:hypothetical protein
MIYYVIIFCKVTLATCWFGMSSEINFLRDPAVKASRKSLILFAGLRMTFSARAIFVPINARNSLR